MCVGRPHSSLSCRQRRTSLPRTRESSQNVEQGRLEKRRPSNVVEVRPGIVTSSLARTAFRTNRENPYLSHAVYT